MQTQGELAWDWARRERKNGRREREDFEDNRIETKEHRASWSKSKLVTSQGVESCARRLMPSKIRTVVLGNFSVGLR